MDDAKASAESGGLFEIIGSFGRFQKFLLAIFIYTYAVGTFQNLSMTFLAPNVKFKCVDQNVTLSTFVTGRYNVTTDHFNVTPTEDQCSLNVQYFSGAGADSWNETVPCRNWEYDKSVYSDTLVNQWDLVCDNDWLISFAKSVFMIGFMTSVLIFGQVSDWIGRLPVIIICYTITMSSLILSIFSTSVTMFLILRFFQALGRAGVTTIGYVLIVENVGPQHRMRVSISVQFGWSMGFILLSFIGYFFRHYIWLQVSIAVPLLPFIFIIPFLPESPRWLIIHKKVDRLKKYIFKTSKFNGKEIKEDMTEILNRVVKVKEENKGTILDLFRTPRMRSKMLNMMQIWLVTAYIYYGLSFNTNDLTGNPYLNFLLSGLLEIPSYFILYLVIPKFGNRLPLVVFMAIGGLACLALLPVPHDMIWLSTTFAMTGKLCVTTCFRLLYLYTGELFPTVVRSTAIGTCSTIARIGPILAPFSRELGKYTHRFVPNILYCALALSSAFFAMWLPETFNKKLPDSLEEGEAQPVSS